MTFSQLFNSFIIMQIHPRRPVGIMDLYFDLSHIFLTPRWILERKQAWNPKFVICNAICLFQIPISTFLVIFLTFCNSSWTISSQLKSNLPSIHSMCLSESETAPATPPSLLLNSVFFYFPVSTPHSDSAFKTKPLSSLWPPQLRASTPHP